MTSDSRRKFPWVRCIIGWAAATGIVVFTFSNSLLLANHGLDKGTLTPLFMLAFILALPKPKVRDLGVWTKSVSSVSSSDFKFEHFLTLLFWLCLLVALCAGIWAVGEEGLKRFFDSTAVAWSLWGLFVTWITKRCIEWQNEETV